MNEDFTDRRVLITGATAGIGRAAAVAFAAAGAEVVAVGRDVEAGAALVAEIEGAGGTASFRAVDVASREAIRELVAATGPVDVLVTSAGFRAAPGPAVATSDDDLEATWAVNVRAPWMLSAAYGPTMPEGGAIVHVSSGNARLDQEGFAAYNVSKAAVDALVRAFAHELGRAGVRVNGVAPGPTYTPYTERFGDALDALMKPTPLGRPGTADEVAAAILFLAGPAASHITGAVLPVDGGQTTVI
jgi:NAD(P)-dependent dehydrogenase (short-subunit alcohol dehydrogenase family)